MQADNALSPVRRDVDSATDGWLRSKTGRRYYPRRTGTSMTGWGTTVQRDLSSVGTAAVSTIKVLMIEDKYVVPED